MTRISRIWSFEKANSPPAPNSTLNYSSSYWKVNMDDRSFCREDCVFESSIATWQSLCVFAKCRMIKISQNEVSESRWHNRRRNRNSTPLVMSKREVRLGMLELTEYVNA